jgi:hypothetical protein
MGLLGFRIVQPVEKCSLITVRWNLAVVTRSRISGQAALHLLFPPHEAMTFSLHPLGYSTRLSLVVVGVAGAGAASGGSPSEFQMYLLARW